jgi:hypothetical protein
MAFSFTPSGQEDVEYDELEEPDGEFQEEPLDDDGEEPRDIPRIATAKARSLIDFLCPYLVRAVWEDLETWDPDSGDPEIIPRDVRLVLF